MTQAIDWLYFRKSCTTCKRAQGFLGDAAIEVKQTVDAHKTRLGRADALALLKGIDTLIAMKGPRVEQFDLKKDRPDDDALLARLLGPTGNLRAPTARVGKTLLVGFHPQTYEQVFA